MASVPDLRQPSDSRLRVAVMWCIVVVVACVGVVGGATRLQRSTTASPFVTRALGEHTPTAPLQRPMLADALQHVTKHGVEVSTHGQSIAVALDGARGPWTRHANGVERRLPYGRESIVLTNLSAEELVTVDRRLGARTWRWRLDTSLNPKLRVDGSVSLDTKGRSRLAILPVAVLDAGGRNITPTGLRWSLARSAGSTWLQLRLDDAGLPLPYVIDPNIALTGTCPDSAGQTDIAGAVSVVAQSCSVAAVAGRNPNTLLVLTAPSNLANNDVMIAQVTIHSSTAPTTPTGWNLIGSQVNGTAVLQLLYWRLASGDTGGTTTWTWSDTAKADMAGGIIAFSNVNTVSPVDVVSAGATGTSLTATAPTVTTTAPNDEVLAFYASANGVTLATSTYGGTATTERYSSESRSGGGTSDVDASAATAPALQASPGATGTSTASLSASQPWVAYTLALKTTSPSSITFTGSRTKALATATWTVGLTASAGGALSAGNTVTVAFPATWTGIPASPTVTFGGSFAGCSATTASNASSVVTVTLPAGCSLANSAAGTIAIAGIVNPAATTYTASTFLVHTSADQADGSPASGVVIGAATPPTLVTFAGSRTKAGARDVDRRIHSERDGRARRRRHGDRHLRRPLGGRAAGFAVGDLRRELRGVRRGCDRVDCEQRRHDHAPGRLHAGEQRCRHGRDRRDHEPDERDLHDRELQGSHLERRGRREQRLRRGDLDRDERHGRLRHRDDEDLRHDGVVDRRFHRDRQRFARRGRLRHHHLRRRLRLRAPRFAGRHIRRQLRRLWRRRDGLDGEQRRHGDPADGCTLANSAAGTVIVAGITDPVPAT